MGEAVSSINQRDVGKYIKSLGRSFDLAITNNMLTPSTDPNDKRSVLVLNDKNETMSRDNVLRLVHNAFVRHDIQVPPFESQPFSELLTVEDFGLLLFVRQRKVVHVRTHHNVYSWGEAPR